MNTASTPFVQTLVSSPLGRLRLVASPTGLAGLWFVEQQRHAPAPERVAAWATVSQHPLLDEAARQLRAYFAGDLLRIDLPLDLRQGTGFQRDVWRALLEIPAGQTTSYRGLAQTIGRPQAVRAVGAAVGRNPLCIVVPCHRVLGSDGSLTGYAGGLPRKQALLRLEGVTGDGAHQSPAHSSSIAARPASRTTAH